MCTCCDVTPSNLLKMQQLRSVFLPMSWSRLSLIISRHNKVRDKILYLDNQYFPYNYVQGKTLIHQGHSISEEVVDQGRGGLKTIDDILIWGLW